MRTDWIRLRWLLPRAGLLADRQPHAGHEPVGDSVEQVVSAADVVVQGVGGDPEGVGQAARGERGQPVPGDQPGGLADHRVAGQS
jgi:hypothetical protein